MAVQAYSWRLAVGGFEFYSRILEFPNSQILLRLFFRFTILITNPVIITRIPIQTRLICGNTYTFRETKGTISVDSLVSNWIFLLFNTDPSSTARFWANSVSATRWIMLSLTYNNGYRVYWLLS